MSRAATLSEQVVKQLVQHPRALTIAGGVLGIIGLLPGMPNVDVLAARGGDDRRRLLAREARAQAAPAAAPPASPRRSSERRPPSASSAGKTSARSILIGLEVGYRLIPLVDRNQSGPLLARIKAVRRKLSEELGFLVQSVHIRDNLELKPNAYRISILGVPVGEGEIHSRARPRDQSRRRGRADRRHAHERPGVRPRRVLDRAGRAKSTRKRSASPSSTRRRSSRRT